jgi:hypothetical protein
VREMKPQTVKWYVETPRPGKVGNDHQHTLTKVCGGLFSYRATRRQRHAVDLIKDSQSVNSVARILGTPSVNN